MEDNTTEYHHFKLLNASRTGNQGTGILYLNRFMCMVSLVCWASMEHKKF